MQALARFVTRHPLIVLLVWALLVVISAPFAARAPAAMNAAPGSPPNSESARVAHLLEKEFGEGGTSAVLLVSRSAYLADDQRFLNDYDAFVEKLRAVEKVQGVTRFDSPSPFRTTSVDKKQTLTIVTVNAEDDATMERVRSLAHAQRGESTQYRVTGGQVIARDFTKFAEEDTRRSELAALPLTAVVLLVVFGALVATSLPLLVGVLSISVTLGAVYFLTRVSDVSTFALPVITMLGLGAGIDYALLMVNRFREELAGRGNAREAARRTILTAGRSVLFSGMTVAIAMGALIAPPLDFVRSMGVGGVTVVIMTVLASVTALPALFVLLGERVNSPRVLKLTWSQNANASAAWTSFARRVIRRPWLAVTGSALVLIALALPAFRMQLGYAGAWGLSPGVESRDTLRAVEGLGAGGLLSSFEVVLDLKGRPYDAEARTAFRDTVRRLEGVEGVKAVISPFLRPDLLSGSTTGNASLSDLVSLTNRSISRDRAYLRVTVLPDRDLRADKVDAFAAKLRAALNEGDQPYLLGGAPIGGREFTRALTDATLPAILTVLGLTFVLLAVAFRSLLIPVKSILMNLLTVGAAYGVVTLIVQEGFLAGPLGIPSDVGVLDSSLPLILFAVLFGLSMDYEIFLLSRVQEEHLRGLPNDEAVVQAVGRTGRIITSAALIMFIVFAAFVSGRVVANKSIGLALALAVALDATLVRMVLVPGFLKLAGKWNWWLPRWLARRLPKVSLEH
ncbi:MMPL family transporter [Deinococcus yavapaiensis]|uniref:RND superfamily putative drug exporter n=1 Tax=Deinococcus yavapaiensis KR-236 TaxID=694435 RepID=A0A318S786_9DEIO|nr:MMPL family transporter [Deinococcus yavapaiensis]PYE54181.1 RND superfamily putative drug exporter [Deinococcus yavapaiensis KR-236]